MSNIHINRELFIDMATRINKAKMVFVTQNIIIVYYYQVCIIKVIKHKQFSIFKSALSNFVRKFTYKALGDLKL